MHEQLEKFRGGLQRRLASSRSASMVPHTVDNQCCYAGGTSKEGQIVERIILMTLYFAVSALAVSEQITYPQMLSSNSIALLLNVDEDVICTIMEDFQLKITIKRDSEVITSKTLPFADNIALFHGISPGEYNCTTNVVNGAMQLESTTFNCTSCKCPPPSPTPTTTSNYNNKVHYRWVQCACNLRPVNQ